MKKTISILLTFCILFSLVSVSANAVYSTPQEIKLNFDYNADGKINLADARTILRVSANLEAPKEGLIYDITGNGDGITMEDVKKVIGIVTGIDAEVKECAEFNLELFKAELNSVKTEKPGFTKTTTVQCQSILVTTRNAPVDELNFDQPTDFKVYTKTMCDYTESLLNGPAGLLMQARYPEEYAKTKAEIANLKKQANEIYNPKISSNTTARGSVFHANYFPINNNYNSCLLQIDDIKSIECYEEDGYIIRKVTMNDVTYVGDEFPTGNEGAAERLRSISYAKVFNIPNFAETEGIKKTSNLNSVTFKDGVIISKVDKLSGLPVNVEYSYTYVADVSTIPEVDANGNEGLQMDSITTATNKEVCVINPVIKN